MRNHYACGNNDSTPPDGGSEERLIMTEGFRPSPPSYPAGPAAYAGASDARRRDVEETVQRIMGEDIAPPPAPRTPPSPPVQNGDGSTTEVAKAQAGEVADTAKQAGAQVAGTVKEQAGQVTAEAKNQAKHLLSQAQSELSEQAASTQQRVSGGLHALADELSGMARNSEQDGVATDLARQAADKARLAAGWLADRDPGSLLDEVRSFARKKPGTYLALALGAGVLAGRLTRGLTAPTDNDTPDTSGDRGAPGTPAYQVPAGRHTLTDVELPGAPGYGADPITDPLIPVTPPVAGPGTIGTPSAARGVVAP
jgi:uncharacterized protein YjbJ (UPF0337 family)